MVEETDIDRFGSKGASFIGFTAGICSECKHLHEDGETCDAFPDGIPANIRSGDIDHHESVAGDDGIIFKRE